MTTREDLVREWEALRQLSSLALFHNIVGYHDALTASIARIDALLGLTDEQVEAFAYIAAGSADRLAERGDDDLADVFRAVADLMRRST